MKIRVLASLGLLGLASSSLACSDDTTGDTLVIPGLTTETGDATGDGDGDTSSGDGDGDTATGDGDGDPATGDGDGDATTGDGDGDATTGDGDGDATGDGDGDSPLCGNGVVDDGEECDVGNETMFCDGDCTFAMCGDGYHNMLSEECDDGNAESNDACVGPCLINVCGDGYIYEGMEECDDQNLDDDDDCTSACVAAFCGDGIVHADDEECDDANVSDNDACTSVCTASFCGDGVLWEDMETCDDGNLDDDDACPTSCEPAVCGDGYVQDGVEDCDDQNNLNSDTCLNGCIDAECGDGFVIEGIELCDDGNQNDNDACPNDCGVSEYGCDDLLTNMNMWGNAAVGFDLRPFTDSTLHWIGCPGNGCEPNTFYCDYDPVAHSMQWGTTSNTAMRAVVDIDDAAGDAMPDSGGSCCGANTTNQRCNAPDSNNNNVNVDMVQALCASMGYASGTIVREVMSNGCPEPHAVADDGSEWSSDFVGSQGSGMEYLCTQD